MNTLRTILASLLVAPGFPVLAEPVDTAPVVVTASRLAETQDETLASVSVITREEIERIQPHSVVELLRLQAGVDVARNGGLGGNTSVFLRGANSDHTLVLIDGVRVSSATTGTFAWQHLDPAQIERIEIVRGPRASLYGSDALGGVIQIFTRRPAGATGRVGLGTHGTVRADAGFGGGRPAGLRYSGQASLIDSSGFDATQPGTFGHDPDDDGYRDESLNARIEAPLGETASLAVQGWHSNGLVEFDQGTQDTENEQAQLTLEQAPTAFWSQRLSAGYAGDIVITDSPFPSDIRTRRRSAEWQHDLSFGAGRILTLGVDYHEDEGRNVDLATGTRVFDRSIESSGAFAGYRAGFGRYDVQLAAREDDHSEFGGARTGSLALGVEAGALRLVASHGTAFKAPTLNQLFHPGFGGFFAGNPDLDPERSHTTELSLRQRSPGHGLRVETNLFYTRVDDLIAFEGFNFQAINIDEASVEGIEVIVDKRLDEWSLGADLTWQRARNETDGSPLLRRPDEKLVLTATRELARGGAISGEAVLVGERPDRGAELAGYGLINLSARYPIHRSVFVEGRIENLLDQQYRLVDGFNTPGASVFVGLRYRPGGP